MLKADLGDLLYIIIAIVLMVAGGLEKYIKAKQQRNNPPQPPPPDENEATAYGEEQTPPETLEEVFRRMMQTSESPEEATSYEYPEETQSLEVIYDDPAKYHQPVTNSMVDTEEKNIFSINEIGKESESIEEYEFDLRQAVIANEILRRKY